MQTSLHCVHLIGIIVEFDLDRDLIAHVIFRYGLDIVTEFLLRGRNEYDITIFDFLAVANQIFAPDCFFFVMY